MIVSDRRKPWSVAFALTFTAIVGGLVGAVTASLVNATFVPAGVIGGAMLFAAIRVALIMLRDSVGKEAKNEKSE
ncbi:hypothetical protein KX928_13970 [Roseobacter sp. YSTF-M11]|uniref:Uncharacterized protein n=1 Tax=Roseobacter insulae TaxID=2859783 RepID=A0A9X1FWF9_9RHOB|nr:hypothetical protein [Roseobacter insulae]MBW4708892.1 hypothetical protein [Roseobacter insulae]